MQRGRSVKIVRNCSSCALALALGLLPLATSAQTKHVINPRLQSLCFKGYNDPVDINLWIWEEQVGHPVPLDKQEAAGVLMGKDASLRKLTASEASSIGAKSGHNYLVAVCVAGSPPVHSKEAFEEWGVDQYVSWNIDNRFNRVLTSAIGMGRGPNAKRTLVYYSFPSRFTLDNHEHALSWAG